MTMISVLQLAEHWHVFFFSLQPNTTIAVFRICFGFLLVVNALLLFVDARLWFFPDGVYSQPFFDRHLKRSRFSLLAFLPAGKWGTYSVLYINLFASLCLLLGAFSHLSALCVFVTLTSLANRNPLVTHAGDVILRLLALLLIFSPAGAMLSVDRFISAQSTEEAWTVTYSPQWCLRLIQLQVCIIYLKAFLSKSRHKEWIEGTAVYYTTELKTFRRFSGQWIFRHPLMHKLGTWGTLGIQFSLGSLVWIEEFRYPVLIGGVLLHTAIEYVMNVQLFGWIMMVSLLVFVVPEDFHLLLDYLGVTLTLPSRD